MPTIHRLTRYRTTQALAQIEPTIQSWTCKTAHWPRIEASQIHLPPLCKTSIRATRAATYPMEASSHQISPLRSVLTTLEPSSLHGRKTSQTTTSAAWFWVVVPISRLFQQGSSPIRSRPKSRCSKARAWHLRRDSGKQLKMVDQHRPASGLSVRSAQMTSMATYEQEGAIQSPRMGQAMLVRPK